MFLYKMHLNAKSTDAEDDKMHLDIIHPLNNVINDQLSEFS